MILRIFIVIILSFGCVRGQAQDKLQLEDSWVSSTLNGMSLEQKIGQLFMVRAYSRGDLVEERKILNYVENYFIGGLCFFQGEPLKQIDAINVYQSRSRIPMFVAIDGEAGLGFRFPKDAMSFPKQTTLGAIENNDLIYEMGKEIARHCKATGININFAPVADINNNHANPVIFDRSYGDNVLNVTAKVFSYVKGLEEGGVMAVVKHFPGHGDTRTDSHDDLPRINHDRERLEAVELFPFRRLAAHGVGGAMVGHLHVPALDNKAGIAASMSPKVVKGLLRDEMSYSGLIFTDAMDMKAITKYYGTNGIAEAEAFLAGNDVILLPEDLPQAFNSVKRYIESGKISIERLDESIIRILRAKYKLGLSVNLVVNKDGAQDFINRNEAYAIKQKLYEAAITLVADQDAQIPIINTSDGSFGTLSINVHTTSPFQSRISDYVPAVHYQWMPNYNPVMANQMLTTMSQFSTAIIAIHTSGKRSDFSRDLSSEMVKFLTDLSTKTKVIAVVFGHPYILNKIDNLKHVICAYENDDIAQDAAAQALFGANAISGRLPLKVTEEWSSTHGIQRASLQRLGFSLPEQVGMNSALLQGELDRIAKEMIAVNATPGAQIFVARQGKIVYNRSHGRMQGDGADVRNHTIYDAASISKILATTLATMKLVDENKLDINAPLRTYISNIDTTNKADLVIADIMAHNARLPGGIPSYQPTVLPKSQSFNANYYRSTLQDNFYIPVANSMFMRNDYIDSLWKTIWQVPLRSSDSYRYSDVGFILLQKAIENITNKRLNEYTHQQFYKPLGLRFTSFLPLEKYPIEQIAPSEMDDYWRMQKIHGHVHDMTAAMMGGVGGHAGLFTTAYEAGIIMQMLLNKGSYGGIQYIKPETVSRFTIRHHKSTRRGLGFDMRELDNGRNQNMSSLSSSDAFGHIGFTGGAAFADPRDQLVFVILTNRTYPEGRSQTYNNREYRIQLHTAIYNAIHR